jgi:type II secretory pathway component PulK
MGKLHVFEAWAQPELGQIAQGAVPGIASREDVAKVFALDRHDAIVEWEKVQRLAEAVAHWIVWDQSPRGVLTDEDSDWLVALAGERPSTFGRAVLLAIVRDAEETPRRLSEFVMRAAVSRSLLV